MANRNTKTDKWRDAWFLELSSDAKLLFIYLTENCDIAGFIEISYKIWSFETGLNLIELKEALELISEKIIYSADLKYLFIPKFILHQNNYPLNLENNAHKAIYKKLEYFSDIFDLQDFKKNILGGTKGLASPPVMYCNSNSNSNSNSNVENTNKIGSEIPQKSDVIAFFVEKGYGADLGERAFEYYSASGWKDKKGKPVKNWRQKMIAVWMRDKKQLEPVPPYYKKLSE